MMSKLSSWFFFFLSVVVVVPSMLFLARNGLGYSLSDVLDRLVNWSDTLLAETLGAVIDPAVKELFRWLHDNFYLPLHLQPHWRHVFVLLWLFFSAYGKATAPPRLDPTTLWRFSTAFGCALTFAIAAGTSPLSSLGVLLWPLVGFYAFLRLNDLGRGIASARRVAWLSGAGLFLAVILLNSPSGGLLVLTTFVVLFALYLLFFGVPGYEVTGGSWWQQRAANPGTRIAGFVLTPMLFAAFFAWVGYRFPQQLELPEQSSASEDGTFQDCEECPRMIRMPVGEVRMGTEWTDGDVIDGEDVVADFSAGEEPVRDARVAAFSLSVTEVTRGQFEVFSKDAHYDVGGFCEGREGREPNRQGGRSWRTPGFPQGADHPVVCITYWDAVKYTEWLSRKTRRKYRLPTEAEWEYAARAGTTTARYWGKGREHACNYANVFDISTRKMLKVTPTHGFQCDDGYPFTAPVGSFTPNARGLHDMLGNVWEWTIDCYRENYDGVPSNNYAEVALNCPLVIRGGGWVSHPWNVRSASRFQRSAGMSSDDLGFRVVRAD